MEGLIMGAFLRVVQIMGRYGTRVVQWCWAHKNEILNLIGIGQAVDQIVQWIRRRLGL
ncbi:aureocin A53 family class IId bacteriocin [Bifidobacterium tibiigranuli]|uniref:aureocin A53 family class IId bacteriocin n=1 Tax=Bifidobacterium tibiigranuli TaxID=2172043 RepID=UPI0030B8F593